MGLPHCSCLAGAGKHDSGWRRPAALFVLAVIESTTVEARQQPSRDRVRKRARRAADPSGIIEVEIDGVAVRVGCGAEAKTVAAVIRALRADT